MTKPTCDNDCTRMGWVEYYCFVGHMDLHISTEPGADLDDKIHVFDHDMQDMVWINGWQCQWERITDA